jgi:taurine transport system permease protein
MTTLDPTSEAPEALPATASGPAPGAPPKRSRWRRATAPGGHLRRLGLQALSVLVVLGIWWLVSALHVWREVFVPSPGAVWHRFVESVTVHDGRRGLSDHFLWEHLWASLRRIFVGVAFAIVFGVVLGLLLASVKPFRIVVEPFVNFIRALPPLAYFSLLIIWFGIEDTSKIWLLFLAAFAPVALAVVAGVNDIRAERIDAARSLGANRWQVLRFVVMPSVLPSLFTGIRLALGFAWTTIVAAETVDGIPGIGGLAWSTKKQMQTDIAVLCIIVIGIAAIALDAAVKAVEKAVVPWRGKG